MRLEDMRSSDNVEDRRGMGVGRTGAGLGLGTIVLLVAGYFLGVNPATLLGMVGSGQGPVAAQGTAVLGDGSAPVPAVRRDQFHMEMFAHSLIQRIAVVGFIADQSLRDFAEEAALECGLDERGFIRRSADHVHGDRKTMAVCDCHDFAAFAAFCRADTRAPFFAELKLASMNASLRSSFPRSRRSSASFCNKRVSSPERCHCWKRR